MNTTQRDPAAGNGHHDGDSPEASPGESFSAAMKHLSELQAYAAQYLSVKVRSLKVSISGLVVYAALGVIGLLAGGAILVTSGALIVIGLAQALGQLLGGRMWAGNLIVGALILGACVLMVRVMVKKLFDVSRQATVNRHERTLKQQRVKLWGIDARQRSAEYLEEHNAD